MLLQPKCLIMLWYIYSHNGMTNLRLLYEEDENKKFLLYYIRTCSLKTPSSFYTLQTEYDTEAKHTVPQSTSLAKAQKVLGVRGCKLSITNLSIIPHTFGIY